MVISYMVAGLGNQMFQYACARALSLRFDTDLLLNLKSYENSDRQYQLDKFNIAPQPKFSNGESIEISIFEEPNWHGFFPEVLNLHGNVMLIGFFQSETYFIDFADQIRRDFTLKDPISEASRIWANRIQNDPMPVSLHIRRTDYVAQGEYLPSIDYYKRCIGILRENFPEISLYIFSDDLNWCRQNLNFGLPTYFVDANDESRGYEDMFLISLCRHHVNANSSFSWWGAWLDNRAGSLVFAPRRYFKSYYRIAESKRIPQRWIIFEERLR